MFGEFEGGAETLTAFTNLIMCNKGFGSCIGTFFKTLINNAVLMAFDIFKEGFEFIGDLMGDVSEAFDAAAGALNDAAKWLGQNLPPGLNYIAEGIMKYYYYEAEAGKYVMEGAAIAGKAIASGLSSAAHWVSSWSDAKLKHVIRIAAHDFVSPGIHLYEFEWNALARKEYGLEGRLYGVLTREVMFPQSLSTSQ